MRSTALRVPSRRETTDALHDRRADPAARDGGATKHFAVRLSGDQRGAFGFDFGSNTQANYDGSHLDVHDTSIVTQLPDASLALNWAGSRTGFGTIEGDNVTADAPVQVL